MAYPIKTKRGDDDTAKAHKYLGKNYKDGGRVKDDAGTNIHISINAAPKPAGMGGPDPALAAALSQAAQPPPPPPMPPPGMAGPPMGGPPDMGAGAGAGPIAMRRGGRVANKPSGGETSAATKTKGDKIRPTHAPVPPPARKAKGGSAGYPQLTNESGGGEGGLGRLRKAKIAAKQHA